MRPAPPLPKRRRDGSRLWRTRDLLEQVRWLQDAAAELEHRSLNVIRRACADLDDGTGAQSGEKVAGGRYAEDGSVPGPVPSIVLARFHRGKWAHDPVALNLQRLVGAILTARAALAAALNAAAWLGGMDPGRARELAEQVKELQGRVAAACVHCGRWVPGTVRDRIRSGRCEACYRYRLKHGTDRPLADRDE